MRKRFVLGLFPVPKFNVGKDLTIVVQVNGSVINQFGLHERTSIKSLWSEESSVPTNYGGLTIKRALFDGYDMTIDTSRVDGVVDELQQFLQDVYLSGAPDVVVTATQTVINTANNTVNQYQYLDGMIMIEDSGEYAGKAKVKQAVKMFFPRRNRISLSPAITLGGGLIPTGIGSL